MHYSCWMCIVLQPLFLGLHRLFKFENGVGGFQIFFSQRLIFGISFYITAFSILTLNKFT